MIPRYRAWNKATKAMYEVDDIMSIDFGKSKISVKTLFFERTNYYNFDDIVLMRSTGLTDKNGKEIFEGDILCDEGTEQEDELVYVAVSYRDGMWVCDQITSDDCGYCGALNEFSDNYSVIGNICTNPWMLEVKQ